MTSYNECVPVKFGELKGKTITKILVNDEPLTPGHVLLYCMDGTKYELYHEQDCCEMVYLEDVCGCLDDLVGSEILLAEEVSNATNPAHGDCDEDDFHEWTFYKLATNKGAVTLRWYGTSNGYYSTSVTLYRVDKVAK